MANRGWQGLVSEDLTSRETGHQGCRRNGKNPVKTKGLHCSYPGKNFDPPGHEHHALKLEWGRRKRGRGSEKE